MNNSSIRQNLIAAAKARQEAEKQNRPKVTGGCRKIFFLFVGLFLLLCVGVIYVISKHFFMDQKGFDREALIYATPAQVDLAQSILRDGYRLEATHCITRRAVGTITDEFGEAWFFCSRLSGSEDEKQALCLLLTGPREDPDRAFLEYSSDTLFAVAPPIYTDQQLSSKFYRTNLNFSGIRDINRYFKYHFDQPELREKGVLWSLYGFGPEWVITAK